MATTFEVFFLGNIADIDPTEGDSDAESATAILGSTFGTAGDPLASNIEIFEPGSTGYAGGPTSTRYDPNNASINETFTIDGGAEQTFDSIATYNATITYTDATTATITAIVFQDTDGNLYLAPETTQNADQDAMEAKAIESLSLDTLVNLDPGGLEGDRIAGNYVHVADGVVDGTGGDDTIDNVYVDIDGDEVDGSDGDPDIIRAGAGADTVAAGDGADTIDGGAGADVLDGGADADTFTITDGFGSDTISGGETTTTGTDDDLIDASGVTTGVTVSFTADEAGTITDGTDTITFTEVERLILTDQDDTVTDAAFGGTSINVDLGAGHDVVTAGIGNDTVLGGDGNDTIDAGLSSDTVDGGAGNDLITDTGNGFDLLQGGAGDDTLDGGTGNDTLDGGADADTFAISNSFGSDIVTGGETITTGTDFDSVDLSGLGAAATVTYSGDEAGSVVSGSNTISFSQIEHFTLTGLNDSFDAASDSAGVNVDGGLGADTISGGAGADSIDGGAGEDRINFGDGDTIVGGADDDYIFIDASASSFTGDVNVHGGTGVDGFDLFWNGTAHNYTFTSDGAGTITGHGGTITFDSFEYFFLDYGDNTFDASVNTTGLEIQAIGGNDTITTGAGNDTIWGSTGDSSITGGDGADQILGQDGSDTIAGGAGADVLDGGADADTFILEDGFGNDTITGGDTVTTGANLDTIDLSAVTAPVTVTMTGDYTGTLTDGGHTVAFSGVERLILSDSANILDTNENAIDIVAGSGNDTITDIGYGTADAGAGDDYVEFDHSAGTGSIEGGAGNDTLNFDSDNVEGAYITLSSATAGSFSWATAGGGNFSGIEMYDLSAEDDAFDGSAATTGISVIGGAGSDTINGGSGADTISGGTGADSLSGGGGNDVFEFENGFGNDTIEGGETGDDWSDALHFMSVTSGVTVTYTGNEAGTVTDGTDTVTFSEIEGVHATNQADT